MLKLEIPRARKDNLVDPTLDFLPSDPESDEEEQRSGSDVQMAPPFALRPAAPHKRQRLDSERIGGLPHLPLLPAKHAWIHTAVRSLCFLKQSMKVLTDMDKSIN